MGYNYISYLSGTYIQDIRSIDHSFTLKLFVKAAIMSNVGRENDRPSRKFLRQFGGRNWGFAIYRTVYTPESDALWPLVLAKLEAYIHTSIWADVDGERPDIPSGEKRLDSEPNRQVSVRLKCVIISDPQKFDGAAVSDIGRHFVNVFRNANPAESPGVSRNACLVIDRDVFCWLRDAPIPVSHVNDPDLWIKVVDGDFDLNRIDAYDPRYQGWALSNARLLWSLYSSLDHQSAPLGALVNKSGAFDGQCFRWLG